MVRHLIGLIALGAITTATPMALAEEPTASSYCACGNPFDRAYTSPLAHREYISEVTPYRVITTDKRRQTLLEGATIRVVAVPGVTTEWLQRLVNEHLAANALPQDRSWDPLAVDGAVAEVRPAVGAFDINVLSGDRATAREVLHRADALRY